MRGIHTVKWLCAFALLTLAVGCSGTNPIKQPDRDACKIEKFVPPAAGEVPDFVVEQYKAYLADLGAFGGQAATTQTFYLTLVAALIAVLAFKDQIRPLRDYAHPVPILVFIFIAATCFVWSITAYQFENVLRAKFNVLRDIEAAYPSLYPVFSDQSKYYFCRVPDWMRSVIADQLYLVAAIGTAAAIFAVIGIFIQLRPKKE